MKRDIDMNFSYNQFKIVETLLENELRYYLFENDDEFDLDYAVDVMLAYRQYRDAADIAADDIIREAAERSTCDCEDECECAESEQECKCDCEDDNCTCNGAPSIEDEMANAFIMSMSEAFLPVGTVVKCDNNPNNLFPSVWDRCNEDDHWIRVK